MDSRLDDFLQAFWPNLAATSIGVALGIPVALWLYNYGARKTRRQLLRDDEARLADTVKVLKDVLREHVKLLDAMAERDNSQMQTVSHVKVAVWDAVRLDAFRLIPDVELRGNLASHFEFVERVDAAQTLRTERALARQSRSVSMEQRAVEDAVHETLRTAAIDAARTARELLQALEALGARRAATDRRHA